MKRTGKNTLTSMQPGLFTLIIPALAALLLLEPYCFTARAQSNSDDITATASVSSNRLSVGDRFILSLELKGPRLGNVSRPVLPEIPGVRTLSRIPTSTSGLSVINGVATSTKGFRFTLEVTEAGSIEIPPIRLETGGKVYETQGIRLDAQPAGQTSRARQNEDNIYVQLELSDEQPYVGEQVLAEVVLYFHSDLSIISYQPATAWRTEGFWMERLDEEGGPRAETVMKNGVPFRRAVLMRYALFPTRSGTLRLGEYELRTNVRATRRFGDSRRFFGDNRRRALDISSESMEIQVRALPEPRPEGFTGAVGQFSVERMVPETEVIIGEPLEIKTEFTGTGNINLINKPEYEVPARFEAFRPTENTRLEKSLSGIRGSKSFTDVLIARRVGPVELSEQRVHWFDPEASRYRYVDLPSVALEVLRDTEEDFMHVEAEGIRVGLASGPVNWQQAGENVRANHIYARWWFWALFALPFAAVSAGYARRRFLHRMGSDAAFARNQRAETNALERLSEADRFAENQEFRQAYAQLHKVLQGMITDTFSLPEAGQSDQQLIETLRRHDAGQALLEGCKNLLFKAQHISYAPGQGAADFPADRERCETFIKQIKALS